MKKLISIISVVLCLAILCGCTAQAPDSEETQESTNSTTEATQSTESTQQPTTGEDPTQKDPEVISLDGKKIIFIGDSFVYYGQTVLEKSTSYLKQSDRVNDKGYFYQLCKANGENVSVTNFTFGGHGLSSFCSGKCNAEKSCKGEDHFSYLIDRNYDYVVVSGQRQSTTTAESFLGDIRFIMEWWEIMSLYTHG